MPAAFVGAWRSLVAHHNGVVGVGGSNPPVPTSQLSCRSFRTLSDNTETDRIYARERDHIERFSFDEQVARVFPDMIRRSVPGYGTIVEMTGILAARYARPDTRLYDLGCSLGASTLAMARLVPHRDCRIIAVDNSPAMIGEARSLLAQGETPPVPVELQCGDVRELRLENASVVVLNFTLQFLPPTDRDRLIDHIAEALLPGGILILSEKVCFQDPAEEQLQQALHHAFKRNNGYSELEISQKRTALEEVLIPETLEAHRRRLEGAGFSSVHPWFRCFNFLSLVAQR